MKVQSTAQRPLLMFVSAPEDGGGGAYRVDPGEVFEVPDGTRLPPNIVQAGAAKSEAKDRSARGGPSDSAAGKGDA